MFCLRKLLFLQLSRIETENIKNKSIAVYKWIGWSVSLSRIYKLSAKKMNE